MKKLTMEKLEELETKIVEWAKRWNISLKYWHIDLPGKCYVPENDESYEWDNEELKKFMENHSSLAWPSMEKSMKCFITPNFTQKQKKNSVIYLLLTEWTMILSMQHI